MEEKYIYRCEYCGKVYDCREVKHYTIDIPGEKLLRQACSLECAKKYKKMIIEDAKYKYLHIKRGTKIIAYKEEI